MNRALYPSINVLASDEEEEHFQGGDDEGYIICHGPSLGLVWSGSTLAVNDTKVSAAIYWENIIFNGHMV